MSRGNDLPRLDLGGSFHSHEPARRACTIQIHIYDQAVSLNESYFTGESRCPAGGGNSSPTLISPSVRALIEGGKLSSANQHCDQMSARFRKHMQTYAPQTHTHWTDDQRLTCRFRIARIQILHIIMLSGAKRGREGWDRVATVFWTVLSIASQLKLERLNIMPRFAMSGRMIGGWLAAFASRGSKSCTHYYAERGRDSHWAEGRWDATVAVSRIVLST